MLDTILSSTVEWISYAYSQATELVAWTADTISGLSTSASETEMGSNNNQSGLLEKYGTVLAVFMASGFLAYQNNGIASDIDKMSTNQDVLILTLTNKEVLGDEFDALYKKNKDAVE